MAEVIVEQRIFVVRHFDIGYLPAECVVERERCTSAEVSARIEGLGVLVEASPHEFYKVCEEFGRQHHLHRLPWPGDCRIYEPGSILISYSYEDGARRGTGNMWDWWTLLLKESMYVAKSRDGHTRNITAALEALNGTE